MKLFIRGNEWYNTIDAPYRMRGTLFSNVCNIQAMIRKDQKQYKSTKIWSKHFKYDFSLKKSFIFSLVYRKKPEKKRKSLQITIYVKYNVFVVFTFKIWHKWRYFFFRCLKYTDK